MTDAPETPLDMWVYTCRDAQGQVLYVGITSRSMGRFADHQATAAWTSLVADIEIRHCGGRADAETLERELIAELHPPYNVTHAAPEGAMLVTQAAKMLHVSAKLILRLIARGELDAETYKGHYVVTQDAIDALLDARANIPREAIA